MNRRQFLKNAAAALVLPALSKSDSVAKVFTSLNVDRGALVGDVRFAEFQKQLLNEICSAMHVPYELLTDDYSKTNYAKAVLST